MALGNQITVQSRSRPVKSLIGTAGTAGNGVGICYGMGSGSVRIAGVTYSIQDVNLVTPSSMATQIFVARVVVINGDYPYDATQFLPTTDLSQFDVLFDELVNAAQGNLPAWFSGMVTDDGLRATALISQLFFPTGVPASVQPQSTLLLHADHYQSRELALSPGSIFVR